MLKNLDIFENDYAVTEWYVETHNNSNKIVSYFQKFAGMNELQDYRDSGVYNNAGVPFEIKSVCPEKYSGLEPYLAFAKAYSDLAMESVERGNCFLAVGSYCTHVPSMLGGMRRALGKDKKIGVVWLDAHADNHIIENTKIEHLRLLGVPMAVFLGQTCEEWRRTAGLIPPISGTDTIASDIRYKDPEGSRNLADAGVQVIEQADFRNAEYFRQQVNNLAKRVDAVYLHIDADILHHSYVPAYEYDVVNGNCLETVKENIASIMQTGKVLGVSVMCIGFLNQPDRLRDVNNMNGIRLVSNVLRNWK